MKKINYFTFLLALLIVTFSSCAMRDELNGSKGGVTDAETGEISLSVGTEKVINVMSASSRAESKHSFDPADLDVDAYIVKITDTETEEVTKEMTYKALKDLGGDLKLPAGKYKIEAYNYDGSASKTSERPYFYGVQAFNILAGKTTTVALKCRMKTIGIMLELTPEFVNMFSSEYEVTISNGDGAWVSYKESTLDKTYYMAVPKTESSALSLIFSGVTKDGKEVAYQTTIMRPEDSEGNSKLVENEIYIIKLKPETAELGKIKWGITVDLLMNDRQEEITVPVPEDGEEPVDPDPENKTIKVEGFEAVVIKASEMDEDNPVFPTVKVKFDVPRGIENLFVTIGSTSDDFLAAVNLMELGGKFDVANPNDDQNRSLVDLGLIDESDPVKGKTEYTFDLSRFMELFPEFGFSTHTFDIEVHDGVETVKGTLSVQLAE